MYIFLNQVINICFWLLPAVVVAITGLHSPLSMAASATVAAPGGESAVSAFRTDAAEARQSGHDNLDERAPTIDPAAQVQRMYGADGSVNPAAGVTVMVNGVAMNFDATVARSYLLQRVDNAGADGDELPLNAESRDFAHAGGRFAKGSQSFNEHIRSVSDNGFLSTFAAQVNEWDRREIRPPDWLAKLRDAVADEETELTSTTPRADDADSMVFVKQALYLYVRFQEQIKTVDAETIFFLAIVIAPLVLLGFAWRAIGKPGRGSQKRRRRTRSRSGEPAAAPVPVAPAVRTRRRRRRFRSLRIRTRLQH